MSYDGLQTANGQWLHHFANAEKLSQSDATMALTQSLCVSANNQGLPNSGSHDCTHTQINHMSLSPKKLREGGMLPSSATGVRLITSTCFVSAQHSTGFSGAWVGPMSGLVTFRLWIDSVVISSHMLLASLRHIKVGHVVFHTIACQSE